MRIAEISTLARPVPPTGEGSIEHVVSMLTEGLVQRGHDVTLFATADSRTSARLCSPVKTSYATDHSMWDWQVYEAFQVREAFRQWREFDLIHCHSYHHGLLFCDLVPNPSLHTMHIEAGPDYQFLARHTSNRHLHFASNWQAREFDPSPNHHMIPHGIDFDRFPEYKTHPGGKYLAFLGRFIPDKGALEAIELARRTEIPLKLAAPYNEYYETIIKSRVDGQFIEYVGEIGAKQKSEFLSEALALVYPVLRGEPFGLVLIEAMACGLPVLALNQGAVPEIVEHGRTGWIGKTLQDLAQAASQIDRLDPVNIRRRAVERFSMTRIIEQFDELMQRIVREHPPCQSVR